MDKETVYDENGLQVSLEDRDYLEQQATMREQRDWEYHYFRPTADPQRQAFQATLREVENAYYACCQRHRDACRQSARTGAK